MGTSQKCHCFTGKSAPIASNGAYSRESVAALARKVQETASAFPFHWVVSFNPFTGQWASSPPPPPKVETVQP